MMIIVIQRGGGGRTRSWPDVLVNPIGVESSGNCGDPQRNASDIALPQARHAQEVARRWNGRRSRTGGIGRKEDIVNEGGKALENDPCAC